MASIFLDLDVSGVPSGRLRVLRVDGEEQLSKPFRFDVRFASADATLDLGGMLGAAATLTLRQGSLHRTVHGCVGAVEQGEQASDGTYLYSASLVPHEPAVSGVESVDTLPVVPGVDTLLYVGSPDSPPLDELASIFRVRHASGARSLGGGRAAGLTDRWRREGNAVLSGESSLCTLSAGHRFTLRGHFRDDMNREYAILKVSHRAEVGPAGYRCTIEAARASALDAMLSSPRGSRSARKAGQRGPAARSSPAYLPLEAQLLGQDYTDTTPSTSWARVYVPSVTIGSQASAVGYLRLGPTPGATDTVETPFQKFWPAFWPTANFNGVLLYTDTNSVFAALSNAYEYTGSQRWLNVGPTATTAVVTPTFRPQKSSTSPPSYAPPSGNTPPAAITGLSFAGVAEVNSTRKLTVQDLLVEEVFGDHVDYVQGSRFEYIAGNQNLVLYGDQTKLVQANLDDTVQGNTQTTYNGSVTNNYQGPVANNYGGDYNATYGGSVDNEYNSDVTNTYKDVVTTTAYGVDQKYTFGGMMTLRLAFNFDFTLAVPLVNINLGLYVRFLNFRATYFDSKFDYVVTLKFDKGSFNVNKWSVGFAKTGLAVKEKTVSMGGCVAAMAATSLLSVVGTALVKGKVIELNA